MINNRCVDKCLSGLTRDVNGLCAPNNDPGPDQGDPIIDTEVYDGLGIIESFKTKPNSRIVNIGGICEIDWKIRDNAFETLTDSVCFINPGNVNVNATSPTGIFSVPNFQSTTEYTLICSGKDQNGSIITESKKDKCVINPSIIEI
jgi:hypothetical protein